MPLSRAGVAGPELDWHLVQEAADSRPGGGRRQGTTWSPAPAGRLGAAPAPALGSAKAGHDARHSEAQPGDGDPGSGAAA
jgi:hypothetical protein